jgi:hypothetical protein
MLPDDRKRAGRFMDDPGVSHQSFTRLMMRATLLVRYNSRRKGGAL